MSRPGKTSSRCCENSGSIDIRSSKCPCFGQSFTIQILPSFSTIVALISPTFSFISTSTGKCPSRICCRISGTHFGHSESVERGHPSGGFDFSHDFKSGLSDHFGVGDALGRTRFRRSKTAHAPVAATVTAFSTYLIGLCIQLSLSSTLGVVLVSPTRAATDENGIPRGNLEASMRRISHRHPIESRLLRHAEGRERAKIGSKRSKIAVNGT